MIKDRKIKLFVFLVFTLFFVFFTKAHPIVIADSDDWLYACYFRTAIPIFKSWNPARVFAEVVMPLVSKVGAYVIYPLLGKKDLFESFTFSYAISVSIAITVMSYFYACLFKKISKSTYLSIAGVIFVLLAHFWMFRSRNTNNIWMFYSNDACVFYYYVIPNIINVIYIILFFINKDNIDLFSGSFLKRNVLLVFVYFCIFSNIWASIIIAVFSGINVLLELIKQAKEKINIKSFIHKNKNELVILCLWSIQQFLELTGGRAESATTVTFLNGIKYGIQESMVVLSKINNIFLLTLICFTILAIYVIYKNLEYIKNIGLLLFNLSLNYLYVILSCAKVDSAYVSRPEVFYCVFFWFIMIFVYEIYIVAKHLEWTKMFVGLILVIGLFNLDTVGKTFVDIYTIEPAQANAINNDILEQIKLADQNNEDLVLLVPDFNNDSNWPYSIEQYEKYSNLAYEYGITKKLVKIVDVKITNDKNYLFE